MDSIVSGKTALKYSGRGIDAMKGVAHALRNRSLHDFEQTRQDYSKELTNDFVIDSHLNELYDTLLEQNLLRLLEPFSRVEIAHVAKLIGMQINRVENK